MALHLCRQVARLPVSAALATVTSPARLRNRESLAGKNWVQCLAEAGMSRRSVGDSFGNALVEAGGVGGVAFSCWAILESGREAPKAMARRIFIG